MRNDFYLFAASEQQRRQRQQQRQGLHELQDCRGSGGDSRMTWGTTSSRSSSSGLGQPQRHQWQMQQEDNMLHRGRDWAARILHRGGGSLRMNFPNLFYHGRKGDDDSVATGSGGEGNIRDETRSMTRYTWMKDPTTSMAAAAVSMRKDTNNKKVEEQNTHLGMRRPNRHQPQQKYDGVVRGGENNEIDQSDSGKKFDKDVVFRYLKLQASVRLRQLGYGKCTHDLSDC